jgi:molybdopterin-containing oxidoreductase family iron-sulfur binding subunit
MADKSSRNQPVVNLSRRKALKGLATGIGALALPTPQASAAVWEAFFQRHFRELSQEDLKRVLTRLETTYRQEYGRPVTVKATPPLDGVKFGYGLDLSRCIGCRRCVYGCVAENNQSRQPQIHWIRVVQLQRSKGIDLDHAEHYFNPSQVPEDGHFYLPVQCQQCEEPSCTRVCPVKATWAEPDGIVAIDYNWCIGCRYCMAACPYGARHFNWEKAAIPAGELNPDTHYLGNRPRPVGVVEKCTFCIQRVREQPGRYPACVEACPVGARKFGNLLDPQGEIRQLLEHQRVFILKQELNTQPKFFYFFAT